MIVKTHSPLFTLFAVDHRGATRAPVINRLRDPIQHMIIVLEWLHRKLKAKYGGCSFKTGNRIKYLGIFINVNDDGSIDLDCEDVFTDMLKDYKIQKKSTYPAGRGLFNVRGKGTDLIDEQKSEYLSRIMKIQYYAKKVRVELLTTLAFLRTGVSVVTTEDWDESARLLYYINET